MNIKTTCCFTGHRPEKLSFSEAEAKVLLKAAIDKLIGKEFNTFISGMSRGIDLWAAEIILEYKEIKSDIKLICAIPYEGFEKSWNDYEKKIYNTLLEQADEVNYVCAHYSRSCFQIRNVYMVDRSDLVIAFFNGEKGGTKNTINYATKKNKEVLNVLAE